MIRGRISVGESSFTIGQEVVVCGERNGEVHTRNIPNDNLFYININNSICTFIIAPLLRLLLFPFRNNIIKQIQHDTYRHCTISPQPDSEVCFFLSLESSIVLVEYD